MAGGCLTLRPCRSAWSLFCRNPGVGRDGVHVIEDRPALSQDCRRPFSGRLKALFALLVPDAVGEMCHVELGGRLHQVVEAVKPAPHVGKLRLDSSALVAGHVAHLLAHHVDQDVGANRADDQLLELPGVHPVRVAGPGLPLHEGVADVVGEGASAGVAARQRPLAPVSLDEAAHQRGASHSAGEGAPGRAGAHHPVHPVEPGLGDGGGDVFSTSCAGISPLNWL